MTNKTMLITTAVAGWAIFAAPANAQTKLPPTVALTVDKAACTAHAVVTWPNAPEPFGVNQLNVDNRGAQDDGRQTDAQSGDQIIKTAGTFTYDVTLAKNASHYVEIVAAGGGVTGTRAAQTVDCTVPVPPERIEVPGPERRVEVPVNVPGPTKTITKRVKVKQKVVCEHRWSKKTRRIVIVKGTCHRPPRHRVHAKAPGTVQLPAFTG